MKLEYLSASRIKTFDQCQLKYYGIYEEGLREGSPHPLTVMGSAIHKGMEQGVKLILSGESANFNTLVRQACASLGVSKPNSELAKELLDNALSWGFERKLGKCVGVEIPFFEPIDDITNVKGIIDRLDITIPTADVIDLKSQQKAFNDKTLAEEWQSVMYNIAARRRYPNITGDVSISYWVLRHRVQRVWLTSDDAERGVDRLLAKAEEIRSCTNPKPSPSPLCQWCPKYDTCPAANESVKGRFKRKFK